jgi:Mg-chelatase subunit ChlD
MYSPLDGALGAMLTMCGEISMMAFIKNFWKQESGNVSMMFGFALLPILASVGAAVDYSRVSSAQSALVVASDAGALAGAIKLGTAEDRRTEARAVFEANLKQAGFTAPPNVNYVNLSNEGQNTGFRVEATGSVDMVFASFIGTSNVAVRNVAEAKSGTETPLDIVFVLDTTASMEGARMTALKSSVNGILDDIVASPMRPGNVRMSVVPFAQYVNVGISNRNKPWIDVPSDVVGTTTNVCRMEFPQIGENCSDIPAYSCTNDGITKMCPGYRQCVPVLGPTQQNICRPETGPSQTWYGCVGSRTYPLNTKDSDYGTRIPGMMNEWCGSEVLPLTSNVSTVRSTINGLNTYGETYLPSGLVWGWRMLSKQEPFAASQVSGQEPRKFMILVTDGRNTTSPNYPDHWGRNETLANNLTRETCANIAADRVTNARIYTIAFEMDGLDAKSILQNCAASTGGQFFDATNAAQLRLSMKKALESIMRISLSK